MGFGVIGAGCYYPHQQQPGSSYSDRTFFQFSFLLLFSVLFFNLPAGRPVEQRFWPAVQSTIDIGLCG
jgi:hypothetical protein